MKMLVCWLAILVVSRAQTPSTPSRWAPPAAELAGQIADLLGPGPAQLTIRNLSTIQASEIPAIRKLLEQDLKAHGVLGGGTESANVIRVTLSENVHERLWVAEIIEGSETRVAMVHVNAASASPSVATERVLLRREPILTSTGPVLAALETSSGLVVLEPERIVIYSHAADGFREQQRINIDTIRQLARDPRGALLGYAGGARFEAWIPGVQCSGMNSSASGNATWNIQCRASDDPWAVTQPPLELTNFGGHSSQEDVHVMPVQAFYNSARNYFTGVLAQSAGPDLRPFYSLAGISRLGNQAALLVGGIDGKMQMVENGALRPVAGTRDWGSDFAVIHSECGTGEQVIASSSGEATTDSLRAFEFPALEAVPVSTSLTVDGNVTAMWTAPDSKSAFAVVHTAANQYEVDRVTALCN
ncbi:MAG TPA: hypothetical protein VGI45_12350 [Terracidiphilus sp.]